MATRALSVMNRIQKVMVGLVSLVLITLGLWSVTGIPKAKAEFGTIYSVSHVNDIFISSGEAGSISTSVDGEQWLTVTRPSGQLMR